MDSVFGSAHSGQTRARLIGLFGVLAAMNAGAWIALLFAARLYPLLLPLGVTAYVLGLRHAVDADHIAAIDNSTRKLMRDGKRPVGVGFFFSLGHSTIVFALSGLLALSGTLLKDKLPALQGAGAVWGMAISAAFLLCIAAANCVVLFELIRNRNGKAEEEFVAAGGLLTRLLRPALGLVRASWHMYPIGVLFGLGFDTATEVALLGISAASAAGGMPVIYILLLPWLFVAGMSLVDSTEGVAMLGAYGWAYLQPARKFYYNVNVTLLSVTVAIFIGGAEALAATGITGTVSLPTIGYGLVTLIAINLLASAYIGLHFRTKQAPANTQ